jgi:hypothetical protein
MSDPKQPADSSRWPWNVTDQSIHDVMQQQVRDLLEDADLTEEQKQQILVALACPCCGAGGISLTVKLKE